MSSPIQPTTASMPTWSIRYRPSSNRSTRGKRSSRRDFQVISMAKIRLSQRTSNDYTPRSTSERCKKLGRWIRESCSVSLLKWSSKCRKPRRIPTSSQSRSISDSATKLFISTLSTVVTQQKLNSLQSVLSFLIDWLIGIIKTLSLSLSIIICRYSIYRRTSFNKTACNCSHPGSYSNWEAFAASSPTTWKQCGAPWWRPRCLSRCSHLIYCMRRRPLVNCSNSNLSIWFHTRNSCAITSSTWIFRILFRSWEARKISDRGNCYLFVQMWSDPLKFSTRTRSATCLPKSMTSLSSSSCPISSKSSLTKYAKWIASQTWLSHKWRSSKRTSWMHWSRRPLPKSLAMRPDFYARGWMGY